MIKLKQYTLIIVLIVIAGIIYFIDLKSPINKASIEVVNVTPRVYSKEEKSRRYQLAKEITSPDGFLNTENKSITISQFIGKKVVLVDFWTYSCINCQRTTPYLNSWYEKYKNKGFVIIGIHTPEFEFEKDYNNVKKAVEKLKIKYPVVLDNDFSTWTAYKNHYWPRKYLIDIDGYIIYDHIGEGAYEKTEKKIQEAVEERMAVLGENGVIGQTVEKETLVRQYQVSPETYFGSLRNELLGNASKGVLGNQKGLVFPDQIKENTLYLSGDWNIEEELAQNSSFNAGILYKYVAKDVFFVAKSDNEVVVELLYDNKPLGSDAGEDVKRTADGKTIINIKEAGLYKIIQSNKPETHTLKLIIQKPGLKAFTFTFG